MRNTLAIVALGFATTMGMGQTSNNPDQYKVNQSGTQKIVNGPVIEYTTDNSAMVAWTTKFPGGTYVAYGTDPNNLSQRTEKAWGGTNHRLQIKNLQPSTTYYFQVRSEDAHGKGAMGADVQSNVEQFKTVAKGAAPDKTNYNVGVNGTSATNSSTNTGMPSTSASGQFVPLYRMFGMGKHFYTTNASEKSSASGFTDEGAAGYLATSQIAGTQPFYRISKDSGGGPGTFAEHVYTTAASEVQTDVGQGYKNEGVIGYIATSQLPNTVPLYRLHNSNNDNLYTTDASERQSALQQGYIDQGIAGYVWQTPQ
jgi:hypothetical protein